MAISWTEDQKKAIEARGENILVSAAAGSGKTAVLVERVIRKICYEKKPIDRFLIATFTQAAADGMKRKIADAILAKSRENPDDEWLHQQCLAVNSAQISTIHAFCNNLLTNHIQDTDLPLGYSLIDTNENEKLLRDSIQEVLERYYKRIDRKKAFRDLALGYGGAKTSDDLNAVVSRLFKFTRSFAYPKLWLRSIVKEYEEIAKRGTYAGSKWEKLFSEIATEHMETIRYGLQLILTKIENEASADLKIYQNFQETYDAFESCYAPILDGDFHTEALREAGQSFSLCNLRGKKDLGENLGTVVSDIFQYVKDSKSKLDELTNTFFSTEPEHISAIASRIRVLKQLVRQTERLHRAKKLELGKLDFDDLEHEAIKLLTEKDGKPGKIANLLREQYDEILVDEYQDVNQLQDTLFSLISQDKNNLFMVGDFKQCIYQFRNANPSLFREKQEAYSRGEGGRCIFLQNNFRSRPRILDVTNATMEMLMSEQLGGKDYDAKDALVFGADYYPETDHNYSTELWITDSNKNNYNSDGAYSSLSATEKEALTVAKRIRTMLDEQELTVFDPEAKNQRPIRPGDITILMQASTHRNTLIQILESYGIPVLSEGGEDFFQTREVAVILDFLRCIDNPTQDIPLVAILRSELFGFSPEELCEIRIPNRKICFYDALLQAANTGNAKANNFVEILNQFRRYAVYMGVDELVWRIIHELHYHALAHSTPENADGTQTAQLRRARMEHLYELAVKFEKDSGHGVSSFLLFMEQQMAGKSTESVKADSEEHNMVKIMTMHKSKGLEFPVVILFDLERKFEESDLSKAIVWNETFGIAMDYVDTGQRIRYTGFPRLLMKYVEERSHRSENLRLFYVAMTRAKEKLILSSSHTYTTYGWSSVLLQSDGTMHRACTTNRKNLIDWFSSAMLMHPNAKELREICPQDITPNPAWDFPLEIHFCNHETNPIPVSAKPNLLTQEQKTDSVSVGTFDDSVLQRLEYIYPHQKSTLTPIKLPISELNRTENDDTSVVTRVPKIQKAILIDSYQYGATEIGTITHYAMQHLDYQRTETVSEIEAQITEMTEQGKLSPHQAKVVSARNLFGFFSHPLGIRLKSAERSEREFDFFMHIPASELDGELPEQDKNNPVILQGIADCFFYDKGGVVLLDFKTDRATVQTAAKQAEFYRTQIDYYSRALTKILGCPVIEKYVFFLDCGTAVRM